MLCSVVLLFLSFLQFCFLVLWLLTLLYCLSIIQAGAVRILYDFYYLVFIAGLIGLFITISPTPIIAGDSFSSDSVGAVRVYPLRRGLASECTVEIFTFYVAHHKDYGERWIKLKKDVDHGPPLTTVTTAG